MSAPVLRPYQRQCVADLRRSYATGHRAPLLVLPTGAGKTVVFAEITHGARRKNKRTLIVVHRRELLKQASSKLIWAGVQHGIIAAGYGPSPEELVQVASVQTLIRRLDELPAFDLLVIDEAHHCRADQWQQLLKTQQNAKLLGVTATAARLDGRGLGVSAGGSFDDLVIGPDVGELGSGGYLAAPRCFLPDQQLDLSGVRTRAGDYVAADLEPLVGDRVIIGNAVEQYRRHADHQPALVFCVSVEHGQQVAEVFCAAGHRAACVHGGLRSEERDSLISGLGDGRLEVLTSCDLISEGVDVPAVGVVSLLRPTKSLVLYLQQVGRGMRPAADKCGVTVLDHAGNVLTHGLPDEPRKWSLAGGVEKIEPKMAVAKAAAWPCLECGYVNSGAFGLCCECGSPRALSRPIPLERRGDLAEVTREQLSRASRLSYREVMVARLSEAELRAFARAHGYRRGWVQHRLREQMGVQSVAGRAA